MNHNNIKTLKAKMADTFLKEPTQQVRISHLLGKIVEPFKLSEVEITVSASLKQKAIASLLIDILGAESCVFDEYMTARLNDRKALLDDHICQSPLIFQGQYQIDFEQICEILVYQYDLNGVSLETTDEGPIFKLYKRWESKAPAAKYLPAVITPYHDLKINFLKSKA